MQLVLEVINIFYKVYLLSNNSNIEFSLNPDQDFKILKHIVDCGCVDGMKGIPVN